MDTIETGGSTYTAPPLKPANPAKAKAQQQGQQDKRKPAPQPEELDEARVAAIVDSAMQVATAISSIIPGGFGPTDDQLHRIIDPLARIAARKDVEPPTPNAVDAALAIAGVVNTAQQKMALYAQARMLMQAHQQVQQREMQNGHQQTPQRAQSVPDAMQQAAQYQSDPATMAMEQRMNAIREHAGPIEQLPR